MLFFDGLLNKCRCKLLVSLKLSILSFEDLRGHVRPSELGSKQDIMQVVYKNFEEEASRENTCYIGTFLLPCPANQRHFVLIYSRGGISH